MHNSPALEEFATVVGKVYILDEEGRKRGAKMICPTDWKKLNFLGESHDLERQGLHFLVVNSRNPTQTDLPALKSIGSSLVA